MNKFKVLDISTWLLKKKLDILNKDNTKDSYEGCIEYMGYSDGVLSMCEEMLDILGDEEESENETN